MWEVFKKWAVTAAAILCIVSLAAGCAPTAPVPSEIVAQTEAPAAKTETPLPSETPPKPTETVDPVAAGKAAAMLPAFDSVIRAMLDTGGSYAPQDETFFWSTLYLFGVNHSEAFGKGEPDENGNIRVGRQAMQEFATACFADYGDLLEVPDALSASVNHDADWDAYVLAGSDMGETESRIKEFSATGSGMQALVDFLDGGGSVTGTYRFTLVENPYLDAFALPVFFYSIESVEAV